MATLTLLDWCVLSTAAALVGFSKTALGGAGGLAVALFAAAIPVRESTGAVLVLLIAGDLIAVRIYRKHADWQVLVRLIPAVVPGLALGAWFVAAADEDMVRRGIAVLLALMAMMQLWTRRSGVGATLNPRGDHGLVGRWVPLLAGVAAGFTTMTANAAGPIMAMYLLMAGLPVLELLATGAWFFFIVNVAKVPFSVGLHLISQSALQVDAMLVPALVVGAVVGAKVAGTFSQKGFEMVTLALTVVACVALSM